MANLITQVISGGEAGVEIGALVGASQAGALTGGIASRDFMTEKGSQSPVLKSRFGLIPHPSHHEADRVLENIKKADATAILASIKDCTECELAIKFCEKLNKEYVMIDPFDTEASKHLVDFVMTHQPSCINITGNKESQSTGIAKETSKVVYNAILTISKGDYVEK